MMKAMWAEEGEREWHDRSVCDERQLEMAILVMRIAVPVAV
jgi:hypothetical protein